MQVYDLDCSFILDLGLTCKSTDLSKTLLNIRSLSKHAIDTSSDACFLTDILSFKKHILPGENVLDIENTLIKLIYYLIIQLISTKVFPSVIDTDSVVLLSHVKELSVLVVVFNKPNFILILSSWQ